MPANPAQLPLNEIVTQLNNDDIEKKPFESLSRQCATEYEIAWTNQKPKKDVWESRLRLFNNQKRKKDKTGDTTLFTIFQTVLASLYADRLTVKWSGRTQGDDEQAENLNLMTKYDYDEMQMDVQDYFYIWDTLFFGRGLINMEEFDRDPDEGIFIPQPEIFDPLSFLRDPEATSVNGDRKRRGSARYYGREVAVTQQEMDNHPSFLDNINYNELSFGDEVMSVYKRAMEARQLAQGLQYERLRDKQSRLGTNTRYVLTEWFTHWEHPIFTGGKIKRVKAWLSNDRKTVVGFKIMSNQKKWPLIDRVLYPSAHDWDGTSIPDLTEDKQRARALIQNLGLKSLKSDQHPMYVYDRNKVTNRKHLKFGFNKFVPSDGPVNGESVVAPMRKATVNHGLLNFIHDTLLASAEKATATPEAKQGLLSEKQRTLGEVNIAESGSDQRYSLSTKIFGWSAKAFWQQYYQLHKEHFTDKIDEKVIDIRGAFGAQWKPLGRDDVITEKDPNVFIESEVLAKARDERNLAKFIQYFAFAVQEPTANRRYGLKHLGKLQGLSDDQIDRLLPPTIDERIAEDENVLLNEDKLVRVNREDDHNVHLEKHAQAADTPATFAHIETHKKALSIKKIRPELFPEDADNVAFQTPGAQANQPQLPSGQQVGAGQSQPQAPLRTPGQAQPQSAVANT